MSLRQKQSDFLKALAQLITWVFSHQGWELTLGEGHVDSRRTEHIHMIGSLHRYRLAQDLNLFVDGHYITGHHPVWEQIGRYWKTLDVRARWGGDFRFRDYNHVSFEHEGKA